MYVCFACVYTYGPHAWGGQKSASDPLEPELLEMIVSHHMGAGNKYGSSVKAESVLNYWAITQTPINYTVAHSRGDYKTIHISNILCDIQWQ